MDIFMKTVFARDYNIVPNTKEDLCQRVAQMIKAEGSDCKYVFEKGRYDFFDIGATRKYISLSNTDATEERCLAMLFEGLSNIVLDGNGSAFIFHGQILPISVIGCQNVTLCNLTFDWDIPLSAEGEIIAVSDAYTDMKIDGKKFPFKVNENKLYFLGENWEMPYRGFCEFDKTTKKVAYNTADAFISQSQELIADDIVRFYDTSSPRPKVGNFGVIRHNNRVHPGILLDGSSECKIKNITIHNCGGLGILTQFCENISFEKVEFRPNTVVGRRVVSGHDDGLHLSNNRGEIHVSDCYFYGLMDDPINVHGTSAAVISLDFAENKIVGHFVHEQAFDFPSWARQGDKISLVDCKSLNEKAVHTVLEYKQLDKKCFEISFEEKLSLDDKISYGLENISAEPAFYCKNNFFGSCRARGVLVTTRKPVVIENNVFESAGSAILLAGDCNGWYEMGACHDVTIRNNYFASCCNTSSYQFCNGVISIYPEIPQKDKCFHKNILIENNVFCAFDTPVLYAYATQKLSFVNNTVIVNNEYKSLFIEEALQLVECEEVSSKGNRVLGNGGQFKINEKFNHI